MNSAALKRQTAPSHPPQSVWEVLSPAAKSKLLSRLTRRRLAPRERLLNEGELARSIYIILDGILEVSRSDSSGRRIVFARRSAGQIIGEIGVLSQTVRSADVEAVTPCVVGELPAGEFYQILPQIPELSLHLLNILAFRLASAGTQALDLATQDVPTRLINCLISIATLKHVEGTAVWVIDECPTKVRLAQMVGTSREVVSRALRLLERSGEILIQEERVLIKFLA